MTRRNVFIGLGIIGLLVTLLILVLVVTNITAILDWIGGAVDFLVNPTGRIDPESIVRCEDDGGCSGIFPIIYSAIFALVIITGFAYTTLLERRFIAWLQDRVGPNRVGPQGLLQPAADGVKLIFKEDIIPAGVDRAVYLLSPILKVVPVIIVAAVIPLGPRLMVPWFAPSLGNVWYSVPLGLADVNVGILWLLAITSIATYGVVLAGWSSNNKYAMLGGLRATAQMISYELSLGLAIAVPVMIVGSMSIGDIIDAQKNVWDWFVFQNPLAAGILFITLLAEVSRSPFDLVEAEQELTAGFMTEYSGMRFALFMMAEYIGMIAVSMIAVALFFGGYHIIPVDNMPILGPLIMILKVVGVLTFMVWIRGTLPRIRYDRLMQFGWKVLLPLSLLAVAWTAIAVVIGEELTAGSPVYGIISGVIFIVVLVGGYVMLRRLGDDTPQQEAISDLTNDPLVTGERTGIGWALVHLIGTLVAIPIAIVEWNIKLLEGLQRYGEPPSDETAIEASETSVTQGQGGD